MVSPIAGLLREEMRRSWGRVQQHLSELLRREGMTEIQADELAVMPGMDEVAALAGHGLVCLPTYLVGDALQSGRLVTVLDVELPLTAVPFDPSALANAGPITTNTSVSYLARRDMTGAISAPRDD